jgi:hypothetical protein
MAMTVLVLVHWESVGDSDPGRAGLSRESSRIIPDYRVACARSYEDGWLRRCCSLANSSRPAPLAVQARPALRSVLKTATASVPDLLSGTQLLRPMTMSVPERGR